MNGNIQISEWINHIFKTDKLLSVEQLTFHPNNENYHQYIEQINDYGKDEGDIEMTNQSNKQNIDQTSTNNQHSFDFKVDHGYMMNSVWNENASHNNDKNNIDEFLYKSGSTNNKHNLNIQPFDNQLLTLYPAIKSVLNGTILKS